MQDGTTIFVRSGGAGPAVVLIHGFGDTGDMWGPLAQELAKTHTVIVPDLRGIGRSSKATGGYDKKSQAGDIRTVVTQLGQDHTAVVGHDIGTMAAYAYAATHPDKVDKLVVMDAPIPGVARRHYTKQYAHPGAMRAAFAQFTSIAAKDVADNIALSKAKLAMPVLAIGGEKSFGLNAEP
jgi:pimeloyl-ACP methyl ester carboxylesterase